MQAFSSRIFRFFTTKLLFRDSTYLMGMIFIRLARKTRKLFYKPEKKKEFETIDDCMGAVKMKLDKTSYMGGSIYWTGFHHVNEILYLNRILTSDMTFVDIGANQGEFSLFAASKLTHGKVISFEPVSYQLGLLRDNVHLNKFTNITIHSIGLSDRKGSLPIYTSSESSLHSGVHEGLSTLYATESRNEFQEEIRLEIFDAVYEDNLTRLDFIKIDIEGAELFALKGMHKHIEKFKPQILIELSEETFEAAGYTVKDMLDFLGSFGYKAYRINRGKLIECPAIHTEWGNYIFKA